MLLGERKLGFKNPILESSLKESSWKESSELKIERGYDRAAWRGIEGRDQVVLQRE